MSDKLRLTITYEEPDEEGWVVARVLEVPGAISQGRTREEARENVLDALRVMLLPDADDTAVGPGLVRSICRQLGIPTPCPALQGAEPQPIAQARGSMSRMVSRPGRAS